MKHYPEPLTYRGGEISHEGSLLGFLLDGRDWPALSVDTDEPGEVQAQIDATGRRLAACYNACRGVPTEALERNALGELLHAARSLLVSWDKHTDIGFEDIARLQAAYALTTKETP